MAKPKKAPASTTQRHPSRPPLDGEFHHLSFEEVKQKLGDSYGGWQISPIRKRPSQKKGGS